MERITSNGKSSMTNREYAQEMRKICNEKYQDIAVNGELWLEIIERLEKQDRYDEVVELKKEVESALCRAEGLERQNFILNNECEEGQKIVEFQKGKIEAYEYALRCLGGKYGD